MQTYNHLLDGLSRAGKFTEAEALFKEMGEDKGMGGKEGGVGMDSFTALVMLTVYGKVGGEGGREGGKEEGMGVGDTYSFLLSIASFLPSLPPARRFEQGQCVGGPPLPLHGLC